MSEPNYQAQFCMVCDTRLLGDREPAAGVCSLCATPRKLRRRMGKSQLYTCEQCGARMVQPRRGRPRKFCPACRPRPRGATGRRHADIPIACRSSVATWRNHIKTHGEPAEVEKLVTWLRSLGEAEVGVAGPDRFGVYDIK